MLTLYASSTVQYSLLSLAMTKICLDSLKNKHFITILFHLFLYVLPFFESVTRLSRQIHSAFSLRNGLTTTRRRCFREVDTKYNH